MRKLLVALDGSPRHHGVLGAAAKLARDHGAKLVLFRAVSLPVEAPFEVCHMSPAEYTLARQQRARARLEAAAREVGTASVEKILVEIGVPWDAICRAAREFDVDMIVIGSHGYGTMDWVLGTTAAKVVNHADRSVLVVRAHEKVAAATTGSTTGTTPTPPGEALWR